MKYAFFDLDGTLIPVDSSILWAETLLSHVGKDEKQLRAERIQYDVDYKNGCLDINKFEDFEMKLLARFPRRELDELRVQYLKRDIMPHVLPIAFLWIWHVHSEHIPVPMDESHLLNNHCIFLLYILLSALS